MKRKSLVCLLILGMVAASLAALSLVNPFDKADSVRLLTSQGVPAPVNTSDPIMIQKHSENPDPTTTTAYTPTTVAKASVAPIVHPPVSEAPLVKAKPKPWVSPVKPVIAVATGAASIWACIIKHESGGNPTIVNRQTGDASGLFQFLDSTWHAVTGLPGKASQYSAAIQWAAALKLQASSGWSPWRGDGCTPVG